MALVTMRPRQLMGVVSIGGGAEGSVDVEEVSEPDACGRRYPMDIDLRP